MSAAIPILTTSRLILRPLEIDDAGAIQQLFPRWEIVQFMNSRIPWPYPADGASTFVQEVALPAMRNKTAWHWSIRRKVAPEQLTGVISLRDQPDENRGFWLDREWQGRGLMTEASSAVTDFWFETLERPILRVPKAVANVPSRRISERSGMRVIKTEDHDYVSGRLPTEVWEITREEWRSRAR
jgi:[ribosomal protein S5]-alanine N-acetyltransferase